MHISTHKRDIEAKKARISRSPGLYDNGEYVIIDFFGQRIGERGAVRLSGNKKNVKAILKALHDKL